MEGVELEVAGDSIAIPLKVAPDQTFTLERNRTALKENAQVIPNRKAGAMTWRADVRTPGLPPNVRRLGDLRLECAVGMKAGLISNYPAGFLGLAGRSDRAERELLPPRGASLPLLRRAPDLERDARRRRAPRSAAGGHALRRGLARSRLAEKTGIATARRSSTARTSFLWATAPGRTTRRSRSSTCHENARRLRPPRGLRAG